MLNNDALHEAHATINGELDIAALREAIEAYEAADAPDALDLIDALNGIEGLPAKFNLQRIIEALRPFLRVPIPQVDEPLLTEAWNIMRRVDGDLIVCRHLHPDGEECDQELWVRFEELSEEDRREATELIGEKQADGAEAVLDSLDERFVLLRRETGN